MLRATLSEPRIRILAVDDEADLLELNKLFLERSGELEVQCCTSVKEALDLLNREQFDAVVSDYQMPEADGISFLKSLREGGNGIPFILFTGKGREDVVIQALNNGADFYLQKGGSPTPMYAELEHKLKVAVDRRRQTLELQENRNRFRMVLEKLPIGLWLADRDGKLVLGNPAGQRIWGGHPRVGQDEYGVFKAWRLPQRERIRPDDWALGYAVNEGRETDWELLEIEAFDGSRKTIYNWATPLKNEDDDIIGAFVINQEITKEVEALKALEASERRYRTYVERSPFGLFIADGGGHYLEVNEAACRITGYSKEELTSMSVLDLQNADTIPEARSHFERAVRDGMSSGETRFVHRSGEIRHWFVEAVVLSPDRVMAFVQDVTERKGMELALRSANHKLNLLSSLTRHELSNQLMVQMSSLTLMAMERGASSPHLERALEASQRIDSIIKFTRDYEDLGANAPRWHRLSNLLRTVFADHRGKAHLQMDVPETLEIFTDDLISKVFVNLVENALMHGEHVTRIRSWTERDGDDLLIFLSDDGIGVPDELKERIFERGFGKNTGQGLFLTREVLDLTGMRIDEVGESGKGAVFRITVPPRSYRLADS